METFIEDGEILWLAIAKVGSPPAWQPDHDYKLGDIVVPIAPDVGQANIAFQCVGFLAKSDSSPPVFPVTVGQTVLDNQVEWRCVVPAADPLKLPYDRYYLIDETVTIST